MTAASSLSTYVVRDDTICSEYIGLDYSVALDFHHFVVVRDLMSWAMANGYRSFHNNGLNYDRSTACSSHSTLDLYVRHVASPMRFWPACFRCSADADPNLKRFANFGELDGA
jgi:hypothetical protein